MDVRPSAWPLAGSGWALARYRLKCEFRGDRWLVAHPAWATARQEVCALAKKF